MKSMEFRFSHISQKNPSWKLPRGDSLTYRWEKNYSKPQNEAERPTEK